MDTRDNTKDTDCVINSTVRVADVMERVFVSVTPDMTIKEVLRLFVKYRLQAAPVVDENDYLLGIISSADLMYNSNAPKIPRSFPIIGQKIFTNRVHNYGRDVQKMMKNTCKKVMTENVIIAKPEADLEQIAAVMLIDHLKVIPVVDNKRVVGLIKRSDIIEQMAKELIE